MSDNDRLKLLRSSNLGVLATIKRDGRPQLSAVTYHADGSGSLVRVSVTADRAKTKNLGRDPRASLFVSSSDRWSYVVAEGDVQLGPVAGEPHDEAVDGLIDLYRSVSGEHPDWDDFRRAMIEERRLVLSLHVNRLYGPA